MTYNVNVACLELLQTSFDAEEHRLCVVASVVALYSIARVVIRRELHYLLAYSGCQ